MVNKRLTQLADKLGSQELTKKKTIEPVSRRIIENLEDYILLPGRQHDSYEYPDLLVGKQRLDYDEVKDALKKIEILDERNLNDVILERARKNEVNVKTKKPNPNGYLGYLSWNEAQKVLTNMDAFMLTMRQYVDFLNLLKSGNVFDGNGKGVDEKEVESTLMNILSVPERKYRFQKNEEWLDAHFRSFRGETCIDHALIDNNGNLIPHTEILEDYLDEDRDEVGWSVGPIALDYWLKYATYQGLPPNTNIPVDYELNYWPPADGSVVSFGSNDHWDHSLSCVDPPDGGTGGIEASHGVRIARLKE